jgi:hypothetical protein
MNQAAAMADRPFSTAAGAMIKHSMMGSTWQIQIQDSVSTNTVNCYRQ